MPRTSASRKPRKRKSAGVQRTAQHIIDTDAVRIVESTLPSDWLVRNQQDRDYGIDLMLEQFEGRGPTGFLTLVQVKGRKSKFPTGLKLSGFPVRTILYAELFREPFFVFFTSIAEKKTYFVWLQKYVRVRLNEEHPGWRNQASVTIEFPPSNVLPSGYAQIAEVNQKYRLREQGLLYLSGYEWLRIHIRSVLGGDLNLISSCIEDLSRVALCREFIAHFGATLFELNLLTLGESLEEVRRTGTLSSQLAGAITFQMEQLELLKQGFLDADDLELFTFQGSGQTPY